MEDVAHSLNDVIFKLFLMHKTLSIQPEGFLLSDVDQSGVTLEEKASQTETASKSLSGISDIIVLYYGLFAIAKLRVPCDALNTIGKHCFVPFRQTSPASKRYWCAESSSSS